MAATPPERIGKYQITDFLGQGAMGVVYRALDPLLGRYVAIKVMSQGIASDQELRDRFLREARAAGSLQHPNIITIYDFGEADGSLYIAMEYVEGSDLSEIMERRDPLPLTGKLDIVVDALHALDYAHTRGVVHRDVKPANIRVSVDGRAKLMDFGIARLEKSDLTKSGMMVGTPSYMAPEQITGGKVSASTDVFAMGAVLYEFLSNRPTFSGDTLHAVLYKVVSEQPPPLRDVAASVPASLQPIVDRALAKDPAHRYASAGAMARDVEAVRVALSGGATVRVAARSTPLRGSVVADALRAQDRKRRLVWWAGGGVGVVAVGVVVLLLAGGLGRRPSPRAAAAPAAVSGESLAMTAPPPQVQAAPSAAAQAKDSTPAPGPEGERVTAAPANPARTGGPAATQGAAKPPAARERQRQVAVRPSGPAPAGGPALQAAESAARAVAIPASQPSAAPGSQGAVSPASQAAPVQPAPAQPAPAAAQPAPSPSPANAVPQAAESPDYSSQIEALVAAYARAIESKSTDEMRRVYPGLRADQQDGWHTLFSHARGAVRAQLKLAGMDVSGATATVDVSGNLQYDVGAGTQRPLYSFHATAVLEGGAWRFKVTP